MTTRYIAKKGWITPNEWQVVSEPLDRGLAGRYGMLSLHGAGGDYSVVGNYGGQKKVSRALTTNGVININADFGGPHTWGNDNSMAAMTDAYNYLQTSTPSKKGKILLMGGSMGALQALVWTAANPDKVAGLCLDLPVLDLEGIWTNNLGGYKSVIDSAYTGGYSTGLSPAKSPLRMAQAGTYYDLGIPMIIHYGATDALCLPAKAQEFLSLVPSAVGFSVDGDHSEATYLKINRQVQIDFMMSHIK